jgi:hypothetical protein
MARGMGRLTYTSVPTSAYPTTRLQLPRKRYHGRGVVSVDPANAVVVRRPSETELEITCAAQGTNITVRVLPGRSGDDGLLVNGTPLPITQVTQAPVVAAAAAATGAEPATPRRVPSAGFAAAAALVGDGSDATANTATTTTTTPAVPRASSVERVAALSPVPAKVAEAAATPSAPPAEAGPGSPVAAALHTAARRVDQLESRLAALNRRLSYKLADRDGSGSGNVSEGGGGGQRRRSVGVVVLVAGLLVWWWVWRARQQARRGRRAVR